MDLNRPCGVRVSKKSPDAYTKDELIELMLQLGYNKSESNRMTKEQLCDILRKNPASRSRKSSASRSRKSSASRSSDNSPIFNQQRKGDCVSRSMIPLKEHQRKVINVLTNKRGLIAVHSTGSGKTLTAVTASQCFLDKNPSGNVIVITPVSLQGNFKKEMIGYGVDINDSRYFFYTIAGFSSAVKNKKVQRCNQCMVIVDEAHNIRGGGAYTRAVVNYAKRAEKVLLLTATPVVNKALDMNSLISIVDGKNLLSKREFNKILKDPDVFYDYFSGKISIFSPDESEIKKYYPKSENHDIFITMTKEYEKKYKEVENQEMNSFIIQLFGLSNLEVFYNGVRRGSNNLEENSPKIRWIIDKIRESQKKDKFVIFSHFLNAGSRLLMNQLKKINIPYAYIDGTVSKLEREEIVEKYNNNEIKALLISKAGGEGLDLKETRNVIIMEPSWNEATHEQIIGRAVRYKSHENLPKRDRKVDIYRLYLIKPSEENFLGLSPHEIIERKNPENVSKDDFDMISVDLYLKNFVADKKNKIDEFLEMLKEVCIENDSNF